MPTSSVSSLLSGGVSVGILAGVVSGLFYLVVAGFRWAGEVRLHSTEWFQKQLHRHCSTPAIRDATDEGGDGSTMESESGQVREFIERLVESLVTCGLDHVNVNRLYTHPEYDRMFDTYHSELCDVLARLSFALQMAIANKPLDDSDSPSAVHAELKQLVQRVIHEAMALPALHQGMQSGSAKGRDDIDSKTYEDILATAILNKVIERFQLSRLDSPDANSECLYKSRNMESRAFTSRVDSACSMDDTSPGSLDDASWSGSSLTEPTSLTVEECFEEEEEVITYASSEDADEDRRESTGAELDFYLSGLNFIKRHRVPFPELGMDIVDGCEDLEDDGEEASSPLPTDFISPVDSWEENWLFQRRRLKVGGSHQPMPVPMLVPNPSEEYRALIGDQDAEETSDLSDCSEGIYECELDAQTETACGTGLEVVGTERRLSGETSRDEYSSLTDDAAEIAEARNAEVSSSVESSSELGQQDSEYTEDYASVTQRQMNSLTRQHNLTSTPTPKPRTSLVNDAASRMEMASVKSSLPDTESADDLATPPRPGTIAEREHKKWESAAPLPNNPYSTENILKRISRSALLDIRTSSQEKVELPDNLYQNKVEKLSGQTQNDANISRYGRDYYVNASRVSSGSIGQAYARPVEIVMSPTADKPCIEIIKKKESASKQMEQSLPCVGSKVSRWQKEINQREDLWLNNNNANKSGTNFKTKEKGEEKSVENGHTCEPNTSFGKNVEIREVPRQQKLPSTKNLNLTHSVVNVENNQNNHIAKNEIKISKCSSGNLNTNSFQTSNAYDAECDNQIVLNGDVKRTVVNGKTKGDTTSTSSITSSDNESIAMPSVKDLAKQFTARSNIAATSKIPSPLLGHNNNGEPCPVVEVKKNVSGLSVPSAQPLREVHSLTARSISRVFREELKRNLPSHQHRNTHGSDSSHINGSDSCPSQRSSSDVSTTPGYTSDESGAASPTPGSLRNNIAFWEQMQRNT